MRETHPSEVELARQSDGQEADTGLLEHLRWCARCRNVASEYRWLQEEVIAVLATAAATAPAPRPRWWAVQESLSAAHRRRLASWRLSAIAGVVLSVSLMLLTAPVLDPVATMAQTAQVSSPQAAIATVPFTNAPLTSAPLTSAPLTSAAASDWHNPTPTPAVYRGGQGTADCVDSASTPVLILPPTPPRSDA